jgi:uncharacterized protein YoxC
LKAADIAAIIGYIEKSPLLTVIAISCIVFMFHLASRKLKVSKYKIDMDTITKLHETLEKSYKDIKAENEDLRKRLNRCEDLKKRIERMEEL